MQRRGRVWLAAPFDAPAFQPGGPNLPDLNYVLGAKGELIALLARVPDPRKRTGIRHRQANVLMVAICATPAGVRNFAAIGEWAAQLPQEAPERLGCRWHPIKGHALPPSEPTLRRTLQAVDVDLVDRESGHFLAHPSMGMAVAVDGKAVRGAGCGGPGWQAGASAGGSGPQAGSVDRPAPGGRRDQ
ncbi:MAG: transposase family protein [Candidatus Dormibacteria bacterium]